MESGTFAIRDIYSTEEDSTQVTFAFDDGLKTKAHKIIFCKMVGTEVSKGQVLCKACDLSVRKDTLERHWNNKHKDRLLKGEKPEFKLPAMGSGSLFQFGVKKKCEDKTEKEETDEVIDEVTDEEAGEGATDGTRLKFDNVAGEPSKRQLKKDDDKSDDDRPYKRVKEDILEKCCQKLEDKVESMGKDLKHHIDSRLDDMNNNRASKSVADNEDLNSEEMPNLISNCKTIKDLNDIVDKVEFVKQDGVKDDQIGYYCKICFEGVQPSWKNQVSGAFMFNADEDDTEESGKQSRVFRNLKLHLKNHLNTRNHKQKKELMKQKETLQTMRVSREEKIGMNIFRIRYQGIKQCKTRVNFEEDMLKAKLNDEDVGDTRHGRKFAKDIDEAIYDTMKADIRESMAAVLDGTKMKRPAGFVMDKMTPRKRTGQIHAVVVPCPENSLNKDLLVPMMLELPPPSELTAEGLAKTARKVFNDAGLGDDQLEGVGWDGEYVKKGVKKKLIEELCIADMNTDSLEEWITEIWEPAHQLELATNDIKKENTFDWFNEHITVVKDTTAALNMGKGLEQSLEAAEEVGEKFYKLKTLSDTRFSAYFESSLDNFEKRIETSIVALQMRVCSKDKEVKDKASWLLKRILNKKFLLVHLGLIDLYRVLGSSSSNLQTVQQFPWDIGKKQRQLLDTLRKMTSLKLGMEEESGELTEIDESLWPKLGSKLESVIEDEYVTAQTSLDVGRRRGRSRADIPASLDVLTTVENRMTSLCKGLVKHLERRLGDNPTPKVIKECAKCLDMEDLVSQECDGVLDERRKSLKRILKMANYSETDTDLILAQYPIFKDRLRKIVAVEGEHQDIVKRFEHIIFETHLCSKGCTSNCSKKDEVLQPRQPIFFKILHLILKEPSLYGGIEAFLHLLLRYVMMIRSIMLSIYLLQVCSQDPCRGGGREHGEPSGDALGFKEGQNGHRGCW